MVGVLRLTGHPCDGFYEGNYLGLILVPYFFRRLCDEAMRVVSRTTASTLHTGYRQSRRCCYCISTYIALAARDRLLLLTINHVLCLAFGIGSFWHKHLHKHGTSPSCLPSLFRCWREDVFPDGASAGTWCISLERGISRYLLLCR